MPPGRYLLLHWNHGLNAGDKETLRGWILKVRSEHFVSKRQRNNPRLTALDVHFLQLIRRQIEQPLRVGKPAREIHRFICDLPR